MLLNNTRESFSLSPIGTLVTARLLDLRIQADYLLTVVDREKETVPIAVVWIRVTDSASLTVEVQENQYNGSCISTVSATSPSAVYSIPGNEGEVFTINSTSGCISLLSPLNYEERNSYQLTVLATTASHTERTTVIIMVTDVNEPPSFPSGALNISVPMTPVTGKVLGFVLATDEDSSSSPNGVIRYSTSSVSEHTVQLLLGYSPPPYLSPPPLPTSRIR